jgi:hypothetical protein
VISEPRTRARRIRARAALATLAVVPVLLLAAPHAGAASSNTMTVNAGEYTYKLSGSPKAGWVTFAFDNKGVEYHVMSVAALKKGVNAKQLVEAASSQDNDAFAKIARGDGQVSGTPEIVAPGYKSTTITNLPAGHYGMLCYVPAPDGKPHYEHGMVKVFDIGTPKSSAKPPKDGVRDVTLTDSGITIPSNGIPRRATLKITNTGTEAHSFTLVKINSGKTFDEVNAYFSTFFNGPPPAEPAPGELVGGMSGVAPNQTAYLDVDLKPGHYAYVSTGGDAPPNDDITKGLKGEFDVT